MGGFLPTRSCKIAGGCQAGVASPNDDHIVEMGFSCARLLWRHVGFALKPRYHSRDRRPCITVAGLVTHDVAGRDLLGLGRATGR